MDPEPCTSARLPPRSRGPDSVLGWLKGSPVALGRASQRFSSVLLLGWGQRAGVSPGRGPCVEPPETYSGSSCQVWILAGLSRRG